MKLLLLTVAIFEINNARTLKKGGFLKDDEWFQPLKTLVTEFIVETFDIEGVNDKVEEIVDNCMQQDDVTDCLEGEVDAVSDALGKDVQKETCDDAALLDLLQAVYGTCKNFEGSEKIGKCAFEEGKRVCGAYFDKTKLYAWCHVCTKKGSGNTLEKRRIMT